MHKERDMVRYHDHWRRMMNKRVDAARELQEAWRMHKFLDKRKHSSVCIAVKVNEGKKEYCVFKCMDVSKYVDPFIEVLVLLQLHNTPGVLCMNTYAYDDQTQQLMIQFPLMKSDLYHYARYHKYDCTLRRNMFAPNLGGLLVTLKKLHGMGIIHRDIKGENILIDNEYFWYLHDFGNASYVKNKTDTFFSYMANTKTHRPPECFVEEDEIVYGFEVDIWALAITMYHLWFATFPTLTHDESLLKTFYSQTPCEEWPKMKNIEFECPQVYQYFQMSLQRDPAKRFTASQLLELPLFNPTLSNSKVSGS